MTRLIFLVLFAPCALCAQSTWSLSRPASSVMGIGQAGPVLNKPFSGVETRHMTQVLADGTHVDRSSVSNFYRDAAGRMRSDSPDRILIYDPVANLIYNLDPHNKTFTRNTEQADSVSIAVIDGGTYVRSRSGNISPLPSHADLGISVRDQRNTHTSTEDLAPESLNGISVRGSRITSLIPPQTFGNDREVKIVTERWYSDDLQVLLKTVSSDPRFGTNTYELTNIVQAPPDPALFQIPADYTAESQR